MFNPIHGSHLEGAWEKMVGVARCILDSSLLDVKKPDARMYWQHLWQKFHPSWMLDPSNLGRHSLDVHFSNQKEWPDGKIVKAYRSSDNCVCKVDVRVGSDRRNHTRPTTDIVFLCRKDCESEWTYFVFKKLHSLDFNINILLILGDIFNTSPRYKLTLYLNVFFWCCGD